MNNLPTIFDSNFTRNPMTAMKNMQRQMDRIFDQFWGERLPDLTGDIFSAPALVEPGFTSAAFAPTCDVKETDTHYLFSFDVPGVKKDDIKVDLRGNILTVSGERKEEYEESKMGLARSERLYGSFERSFTLPSEAKADQIEANYADGVLSLAIPKAEPTQKKQIKIAEGKSGFVEKFLSHKKEETKKH